MAYNESLADRVREVLIRTRGVAEKRMFGGLGFLLNGKMLVGVWKDALIVRVGPEQYATALQEPFADVFDMTGRPMQGWVMVAADGLEEDAPLKEWIERAETFVRTLPAKATGSGRPARRPRGRTN